MSAASIISTRIKRRIRQKDLIPVRPVFDVPLTLATSMQIAEAQGVLVVQKLKDTAKQYVFEHGTTFSRHFITRLP
ncbi:hypothetical protein OMA37_004480, partial [Vibrio fluvialis]|nr:hypothetical protein [Vibrio fluvialis]